MADVDLLVRGVTSNLVAGASNTVSSHASTAVGDYLLVVASSVYQDATATQSVQAATGVGAWAQVAASNDGTTLVSKAWIGKVSTAGARSVTVQHYSNPADPSELIVHIYTLNAIGGDVTADGVSINADRTTPYLHAAVSPVGTKDLLVCAHGGVQFSGTTTYGAAPAGMTVGATNVSSNGFAAAQSCYQVLAAAGTTGTRSQTANIATLTGAAGLMVALRSQSTGPVGKSGNDSAVGTDTGFVTQPRAGNDTATGTDTAAVALPFAVTDSATGVDVAYAGIPQPSSDSGAGGEAWSSIATVQGTDARAGGEALSIAGILAGTDASGAGSDAAHIVIPGADQNTGTGEGVYIDATITGSNPGTGADGAVVEALFGDLAISLYGIHPATGQLVPLPDFTRLALSPQRNSAGSISLDYPATGLNFDLLRSTITGDRDLQVEIWTSGTSQGALRGYLQEAAGDDVVEGGDWTFAGGFLELRMSEAVVWPQDPGPIIPDEDDDPSNDQHANEKRELIFASATPGAVVSYIVNQAQARGALTGIVRDFTGTHDSNGVLWPKVISTKFSPGAGYDQILERLVALDLAEWAIEWTGTAQVLRLWVPAGRGRDLTVGARPVVLRRGRNLIDAPRKWSVRESGTALLAIGGEGVYDDATSVDAQTRRGRRIEVAASANNLQDETAVAAFAQSQLQATTTGLLEVTHGIGFLPGEPRPLIAFNVGDWVYSQTGTALERLRVVQWTLTVDAAQGLSGTVTLNDTVQDALVRLQGRLNALTSGETVVGTSEPSQQEDTGTPLAPVGLIVGSTAYLVGGVSHAAVTVSWSAVTQNTDGSAASDLAGYKVQYAYDASPGSWVGVEDVGPNRNSATFDAAPGAQLACRVAAYDRNGNVSAWSTPVGHTTEDDTTPPPAASTPIVSDYLGTLRIRWDGNTAAGTEMAAAAPDFDHVQVHVSTGSSFTPSTSTQVGLLYGPGTWVVTDLPYGVTQYARLVAVDARGNASGTSAQGSATPAKLVNIDIGPGAIDRTQIIDGEIVNAKIANLAVNDAKIMNLGVGKLTAGILYADVTLSGIIKTADTGARGQMDSSGIRLWNSSGTLTVHLSSVDGSALVTGTYRSGLTGERINILPDGTLRIYGSSGTDYGEIANEGGIWQARSRADGSGRRSTVRFEPSQLVVTYGTPGGSTRSSLVCGLTYAVLAAPVCGVRILDQFNPDDGTANRFHFVASTNGSPSGDIGSSVLHYEWNSGGPQLLAPGFAPGSGIWFYDGTLSAVSGDGEVNVAMTATEYRIASSQLAKTTPQLPQFGELGLSAADVIERAPAYGWRYLAELKREDMTAQQHYGPLAEDLEAIDPELIRIGPDDVKQISVSDLGGITWAAIGEILPRLRALEERLDEPPPTVVDGEVL